VTESCPGAGVFHCAASANKFEISPDWLIGNSFSDQRPNQVIHKKWLQAQGQNRWFVDPKMNL